MARRTPYSVNLTTHHKVIVGEGESDRNFFKAFCTANQINGFDCAFTGMHTDDPYVPSGFSEFVRYLPVLERLPGFSLVTDIVLACDSGDDQAQNLRDLHGQLRRANRAIGRVAFTENPPANVIAQNGVPRLHVLMVPRMRAGGIETVCVDVARDKQNEAGQNRGTQIEGWVGVFANSACNGWTTEKRDKLRLQAFLSAASNSKPDLHFSQVFDITRDHLIPLTGNSFNEIRDYLRQVSAL